MENVLFSVLMANYNNGRYLQEAIDSVLDQTYTNWEVIIVDDKSTDESTSIYEKLCGDTRFVVLYNEKNMGCGFSKRRCVENARGAICGFLDPDDVLVPNALEQLVHHHSLHPEASVVFSRHYVCNKELDVIGESRLLRINAGMNYFTNADYGQEHMASFIKACYDSTEGISASLPKAVDQDLYFKLDEVGECAVLDKFTYKFRICDTGISHEGKGIPAAFWNMLVRYETCQRRGLDPKDFVLPGFTDYSMHWYREGERRVRESVSYRVGRVLLNPFKFLKKKFYDFNRHLFKES